MGLAGAAAVKLGNAAPSGAAEAGGLAGAARGLAVAVSGADVTSSKSLAGKGNGCGARGPKTPQLLGGPKTPQRRKGPKTPQLRVEPKAPQLRVGPKTAQLPNRTVGDALVGPQFHTLNLATLPYKDYVHIDVCGTPLQWAALHCWTGVLLRIQLFRFRFW